MTLSTSQIFRQGIGAVLAQQEGLARTQLEIASGKSILTPADDPSGAVRVIDIKEQIGTVEQYLENGAFARTELALEEGALKAAENVLQRVRELMLQANNDSQTTSTRQSLGNEVSARIDELQAIANTRNASGDFLFAGFQIATQPFSRSGGSVVYNGDQGQRRIQVGPSSLVPISDSGVDVFQLIKTGNGTFTVDNTAANTGSGVISSASKSGTFVKDDYTLNFIQAVPTDPVTYQVVGAVSGVVAAGTYVPREGITFNGVSLAVDGVPQNGDSFTVKPSVNQDVFTTLDTIAAALQAPSELPDANARLHNDLAEGLENIDRALDNFLRVHSNIGSRLNNLDSQLENNENFRLRMQGALSDTEDLDFAEAISQLNFQSFALEAAQQVFIKVQGLSLFDYIR
ncbi:flagellar hook-associated protein 3 [Gammaproteobacteria bacterium 54_18_T64]|nr:flagellar hook-associated protein 3 [Gammaproteobacteria bacterium 54_18_T64]